jgi:general secretion pathway protein D
VVLNYLSDACGFIINLETEVRGKVDVWSSQPLNQDEALDLLNTVLGRNGYAALRNGRTLTIVSRDDAKKRDIPVISGNIPEKIPKSEEIVTQIIPVRFISATQLTKDLSQLLPSSATMTANEGGNALVVTDSQVNIRRMAEIVQALDQAIASVSSLQVFTLKFADAKSVATTLTSLFQNNDASRNNNQNGPGRFFNAFRGGGPGGQMSPGGDSGAGGNGRAPTPRVIAVADERSNSVVVSAPEDQMTVIKGVVEQIDRDIEQITELRVFRLKFADPQETANLLTELFQDPTTSQSQSQRGQQVRFGGMFGGGRSGGGFGGGRSGASEQSSRTLQQTRVTAVPDMRTGAVVVSASKELMDQIGRMIEQLDSDPAKKQKVFVYSVENTDPEAVQQLIQTLFPEASNSSMRNNRTTQRQNANQLNNRTTQNNNQGNRSSGGTGSFGSSFGNSQGR